MRDQSQGFEDLFSKSVAAIVDYYWEDESRNFSEYMSDPDTSNPDAHIFTSLRKLSEAHPVTMEKAVENDDLRNSVIKLLEYCSEDEAEHFAEYYHEFLHETDDPFDMSAGQVMAIGKPFEHIYHHIVYLSEEIDKIELENRINNLGCAIEEGDQQKITDQWIFCVKPMIRCNHNHTQQKAPKP
jgi:hypothetical protein